ncbi:hypothetical protein C1280_05405 [Gemmata obscuriglobus]|uniref:Uncharacterized protein n=1 Tax=Gemmata obscuriglobus TaxID=114 RepID=A0A2Z3H4H9_9BACT|nr:hypothetical protein C1280_05405 [Gemmata obscuriglobus]VTS10192.1 Uncharacterized protein OS=Singulisphaera acidiphila (strain ATCC BAA-1392 / DSM 18658 / VKM B-2454 / MOB10) GN=Sinac_2157 PE=4 SV=1 [Gemmata obscuriglobus UQM 2246]
MQCFYPCKWNATQTEAWTWNQEAKDLVAYRASTHEDNAIRCPSHADKNRAWRRELPVEEIQAIADQHHNQARIRSLAQRCLDLAA